MRQALINGSRSPALSSRSSTAVHTPAAGVPRSPHPDQPVLDALDRRLLDEHQRGFPVCETPFAEIAHSLGCDTDEVLRRLARLRRDGVVSRIGPVFAPGRIGASTLAAMAVPPARLESVAACVNRYRAVNHNYEREHAINLWFVLAAPDADEIGEALADIRRRTGLEVLDLRLERAYHIDLGFPLWRRAEASGTRSSRAEGNGAASGGAMSSGAGRNGAAWGGARPNGAGRSDTAPAGAYTPGPPAALDASDRRLVGAIQDGLPLTARPYAAVARRTGLSEALVMDRLARLLDDGVIKRMGVVVRHRELGYRANAMVVFDVPDHRVDAAGERLARVSRVTLCYRRGRRLPRWPYNLYCMIHGQDRAEVMGRVDGLPADAVAGLDRAVLFSRRRFRQRGARYGPDHAPATSRVRARG